MLTQELNQLKINRTLLKEKVKETYINYLKAQIETDQKKMIWSKNRFTFLELDRQIALLEKKVIKPKKAPRKAGIKRKSICPANLKKLLLSLPKEKQLEIIAHYESYK